MFNGRNTISPSRLAVALVLGLFFALLVFLSARESYWLDEGYTLRRVEAAWAQLYYPFAKEVRENSTHPFDTTEVFDLNPPLYFALLRAAAGPHPGRVAARLFSALPMVLAVSFIALMMRRAHGPGAMWAVLTVGVTSPALIYYGHEARPYAMALALACALAWAAQRLAGRPRRLFFTAAALTAAGCLTHFAFAWWVIALGMVLGFTALDAHVRRDGAARSGALAGMLGCAAGALVALAIIAPQWGILSRCRYAPSWAMSGRVLMSALALPFCGIGARPVAPWLGAAVQAGLAAAIVLGARTSSSAPIADCGLRIADSNGATAERWGRRWPERTRTSALPVALWLVPLALPIIAKYWFGVAFIERYAFASLAGWLICVGWLGGQAGARRGASRALALGALGAICLVNVSWCALNLGRPLRPQWRPAIEYLKEHSTAADLYTIDPYSENPCFAANAGTPPPARYVNLSGGMPAGGATLWILADQSSRPRWDEGRLDPRQWTVKRVLAPGGVDLFRVTTRDERRGARGESQLK